MKSINPNIFKLFLVLLTILLTAADCGGTSEDKPPNSPSNVTIQAQDSQVVISWNNVGGATSYNIYLASEADVSKTNYQSKTDGQKVTDASSPHTISGLTNGTTYYFVVTALNANGESAESDEKSATPTASTSPPDAPSNVAATAKDGAVEITWDTNLGTTAEATSYNLYLASEAGITKDNYQSKANGQKVESITSPHTQSGLTNGTTYYFIVTAVSAAGESIESTEVSATPKEAASPPNAPSNVKTTTKDGAVEISWDASAEATSYNLYLASELGVKKDNYQSKDNGQKVEQVTSPHIQSGLINDTTYYFIVTAVNPKGESDESIEVSATPKAADNPPNAPSNVQATAKDGAVEITWDANLNVAAEITAYNLYWASEAGITKDNYQSKANGQKITPVTSPYTQSGLTNGTTYYFIVTAVSSAGESAESNEVSATPKAAENPPSAPSNVQATAKDSSVEITWDANTQATSYNLYLSSEAGITKDNYQSKANGQKIEEVTSPYTQLGLTNDTTYYFIVTAVNPKGESDESIEVSATPKAAVTPPDAPSNVKATAKDGAVEISWDTNLNTTAEITAYNLYLASEAGITKDNYQSKANGQKVENINSPYTQSGLTNDTLYYFIITAVNSAGESVESAEVSATPRTKFNPTQDTILPSGIYTFSSVNIPRGVTVILKGDVVINVIGNSKIDGDLIADCTKIEIRAQGDFTLGGKIDGTISNRCSGPPTEPGDLKIVADGNLTIGSAISGTDAITTDGFLSIVDSATENDSLDPFIEFTSVAEMLAVTLLTSDLQIQQGGNANGAINRPVRGRKGTSVRRSADLNINIGINTAGNGQDTPSGVGVNCDKSNTIGGTGGTISLASRNGTLTITGNLIAGNGGKGADCSDDNPAGNASAKAGHGGNGGSILVGGKFIRFVGAITLTRGNGGDGGRALALAGHGPAPCQNGFSATAVGGNGGNSGGIGYLYFVPGSIIGAPTENGANGGEGGAAEALGGDGEHCNNGKGGDGGTATATGGQGGNGATGNIWPPSGHRPGDGGAAYAKGGQGGHVLGTCLPVPVIKGGDGGLGGSATATGGEPGQKGLKGKGLQGQVTAIGGDGGYGGDGLIPGTGGEGAKQPDKVKATGRAPIKFDGQKGADGRPCGICFFLPFFNFLAAGNVEPGVYKVPVLDEEQQGTESVVEMEVRSDGAEYTLEEELFIITEGGGLEFNFSQIEGNVAYFKVILDKEVTGKGQVQLRGLVDNEVVAQSVIDTTNGEYTLQMDYVDGFDDVYLEAIGTQIALILVPIKIIVLPIPLP